MRRLREIAAALAAAALVVAGAGSAVASAPANGGNGAGHTPQAMGYYLALGDSLAAGYQPGQGDDKTGGYVGTVESAITATSRKTQLVNLACSGETTSTMVSGGVCSYAKGSQFDQALQFLHAHGKFTRVITLDIGANDVQRCVTRGTNAIDMACINTGLTNVATNLPMMLEKIHAEAPNATVVVLNYYNPFLAAYLTGPAGQQLAMMSVQLQAMLNGIIARAAQASGARVADVAGAFQSTNWTPTTLPGFGTVPTNVAYICGYTWMCTKGDIHATDSGYQILARAVLAKLG